MLNNRSLKLLLFGLLALFISYLLAILAFPNQVSTRIYAFAVFVFAVACGYLLGSLRRDTQVWHLINDLKLQINNNEAVQETMAKGRLRLKQQSEALATITAEHLTAGQNPEEVFRQISELSAKVLDVERVSFWMFSDDGQQLRCVDMYHRSTGQHMPSETLSAQELPKYFHALSTQRVLAVNDAMTHDAAVELASSYLPSHGIGAFLDGTIWLNDKVLGVICHEHIGGPREWTLDELSFAGSLADLSRLTIETHKRRLAEAELVQHRDNLEEMVRQRTQALENSTKIFKFLFDRANVCILYMDKSTKVIEVNPEIEVVSGYKREQVLGKTFYELFSTKVVRLDHIALFKRILACEKIQGYELKMRRADGMENDYLISASMEINTDGNPVIIAIAQDMGIQKMLEFSLVKARESAESADRIKSMFVASMSHELRTPLNSIIGFIGVVLQGMSGTINDKQKEQLGRAYGSAKHLLSLISDVIDISKIEAGFLQTHVEQFELKPLLLEVEQVIHHIADEKKLEVNIECATKIMLETDRKRLYQVVLNVMSNAVKYTENGSVNVRAEVVKNRLVISIQDTGIGINEAGLAHLFKPFERVESRLRIKTLGTGLGLYLTKKILTQLLGGTVEVKSKPEVGSLFTIKLPLKAPETTPQVGSVLEGPSE